MIAGGRSYVTRVRGRWVLRRYAVVRSEVTAVSSLSTRKVKVHYVTVSRHFTFNAARRAAKKSNAERGHAH